MLYSTRARQRERNRCCRRFFHETDSYSSLLFARLLALAGRRRAAAAARRRSPTTRSPSSATSTITKAEFDALIAQAKRSYTRRSARSRRPGTVDLANLKTQGDASSSSSAPSSSRRPRSSASRSRQGRRRAPRADQEAVLRQPAGQKQATQADGAALPGSAQAAGLHRRAGPRRGSSSSCSREAIFKKVTGDVEGLGRRRSRRYYDKNKPQYATPRAAREPRRRATSSSKTKAQADQLYAQLRRPARASPRSPRSTRTDTRLEAAGRQADGHRARARPCRRSTRSRSRSRQNAISKPVQTQFGWHIIQALGPIKAGTPAKTTPLSQVKEAIRQQLSPGEAEGDGQVARRDQEGLLQGDRLPDGLRAAAGPGSLQARRRSTTSSAATTTG